MSKYQEGKEKARDVAIDWQEQAAQENYSYGELAAYGEYFHRIGKRYGLLREFQENGIPC